jgi:SAM-dependent methyltransferase
MALVFKLTRSWIRTSPVAAGWRERRYRLFMDLCRVQPDEPILDVGAGKGGALAQFNRVNPILAVDLEVDREQWLDQPNVEVRVGDGTRLEFADAEFPIVHSNSVIEHVPKELQAAFASEARRVGQRYFLQTPNLWFPIEPHYQTPFFHFLPVRARKWVNRHFTLGWREKGHWEDVNLLTARDLRRLFPDAEIHRERLFGLTKSLMAVRREI